MKKKKLLSWLLTMLMVLTLLPLGAFSALASETDPAAVPRDKDLAKFLTAAVVSGAEKGQDGTYTVEADKEYGIALTFLETDKLQFADDVLELALPTGDGKVSWKKTAATDTEVKFKSGADELTVQGNKLAVDDNGKLTVSWNKDDANYPQLTATNNVTFSATVTATFAESLQGSSVSLFDGKLKAKADAPAPAEYQVSVDGGISNGAVSVSPESAVEGTKITVHAEADADYELESVTMTPEGGSAQDITGALEFSMPAANVTVTASFKEVEKPEEEPEDEPENPDENLENQPDGNGQQGEENGNQLDGNNQQGGETVNQPDGNGQQGEGTVNQPDGNSQQGQEPENQPDGNGQQGQNNNNATKQPVNTEQGNQSGQTTPPENTENQNRSNNTVIMQHTIEVVPSSADAGTVTGDGSYQTDDDVTVEATPNDGFTFAGWTTEDGKEVSKDASYSFKASSDLKLTAVFEAMMRNTVQLEYNVTVGKTQNGSATVSYDGIEPAAQITATADTVITVTADPAEGYEIDKITWTQEGREPQDITPTKTFTMPAANVTVNVTFKAKPASYTVTFNTNGGKETIEAQTVESGNTATKPTDPTKDGNTFAGWFSNEALTQSYDFSTSVTDNITLFAKWTPVPVNYTVKFDPNGGSGTMGDMTVTQGQKLKLPANGFTAPAKKEFDKWDAGAPGTDIDVTDNMTIKATWKDKPVVNYTVKFDPNGGSGTMGDMTVTQGQKLKLPANGFTAPAEKEFDKWDAGAPGTEINVTDNMTIKAIWKNKPVVTYTVKFDANGGSGSMAEMKVKKGSELTLPENKFTAPANKTFDKWTVGAPGTKIEVNDNLIIKALWKDRTYTVDFHTNGGTKIPSQTVKHGKTASEPDEPTKSGFEFEGWFADSKLTNVFYFGTPITADTTIYVKWSQNPTPDKVTYSFSNNKNGTYTYTKGSGKGITITVKRSEDNDDCFEHFTGVRIDGKALGTNDYIAKSGSTIVTIKATTLEKLATGDHTVTIRFDDGTTDAKLKVNKASSATSNRTSNSTANRTSNSTANRTTNSPRTGDENHAGLWIAAVLASALAVCGLVIVRKRKSGK